MHPAPTDTRPRTVRLRFTSGFRHTPAAAVVVVVALLVAAIAPLTAAALDAPDQSDGPAEPTVVRIDPTLHEYARQARADHLRRRRIATALQFLAAAQSNREAREQQARDAVWDRMAQCETGGNWHNGGQWAGGLGIYVGTWRAAGGEEFAPRPDQATREQQIVVAERIRARWGIHAWGCASAIGF